MTYRKSHILFTVRQLVRSSRQAVLFIICVALSICSITAFRGFSDSINRSVLNDAREFHAADIILRSNSGISNGLDKILSDWIRDGKIERARIYEFNSMVRRIDDTSSLLADIKIVEKGYPFYGRVILKSGRSFHDVLKSGRIVVDQSLLDRLGLRVGDQLKIGYDMLIIEDVVVSEPDRPVDIFSLGPRVFISDKDRERLGLIQKGSRVRYIQLLKVTDSSNVNSLAEQLKAVAPPDEVRIDTFQTAQSRFKRFLDNFLFFLKLVGIFILVLSGFGIQLTLTAFLNEKKTTIAIMKTVGATNRYVIRHFMFIVFLLGLSGIIAGILAGYGIQTGLARTLHSFLPQDFKPVVSWMGIWEGVFLGMAVLSMFTFFPLFRIKDTRPVVILRKDTTESPGRWLNILSGFIYLTFFSFLVFFYLREFQFGLYLIGGILGLILVSYVLTEFMYYIVGKMSIKSLSIRQGIKGLFRKGNATKPITITLTASLSVIFTIYLIEENLDISFIRSYPPDAPNVFFIDIQPSQVKAFIQEVGGRIPVYPVVRARIDSINGIKIDRQKERNKRRDNFSRVFNLTYRDSLLENEKLVMGRSLFRDDWNGAQVSVLDMVLEMRPLHIGDMIEFNIQGVPLSARISSIRTQEMESMSPFFYFVFPEKILGKAPQTIFSAIHLEKSKISSLQNAVVSRFPNISVIDVTETIQTFSGLLMQLSTIVRFFTLLSVAAGVLILISAVFATRKERTIESVYYKVLGAKKMFVTKVFTIENLLIGLLCSFLAMVVSQTAVYFICSNVLEITYHYFFPASVSMMSGAVLLVIVIGIAASKSILAKKPISILKEQPDG